MQNSPAFICYTFMLRLLQLLSQRFVLLNNARLIINSLRMSPQGKCKWNKSIPVSSCLAIKVMPYIDTSTVLLLYGYIVLLPFPATSREVDKMLISLLRRNSFVSISSYCIKCRIMKMYKKILQKQILNVIQK